MKIAVYGDSYGMHYLNNLKDDVLDRGKSWIELLEEKYQVTNFCVNGSSFFYSYKLFLENNQNFDYNILLVTEPNRITLPDEYELPLSKHVTPGTLSGFGRSENVITNTLISSINSYYNIIHNREAVYISHNLMLENIIRLNKKTIIIPCFKTSTTDKSYSLNCISAYELQDSEFLRKLKYKSYHPWTAIKDENTKWTYNDYRKCHLNEENNKILFNLIYDAINNNKQRINLDLKQFVKASKDIEYYHLYIDLNQVHHERRLNGELHNLYNKLFN